jgi:glucose uptake protein
MLLLFTAAKEIVMSFLIAMIPALGWGFEAIVMQKIGGKQTNKVMGMVLMTFFTALVITIFKRPAVWTPTLICAGFAAGAVWPIGSFFQVKSFDEVGVSMAIPLSSGMQVLGTVLFGWLYFHEWKTTTAVALGISSIILVIAGIFLSSYHESTQGEQANNFRQGLIDLIISSVFWVAYAVIPRMFNLNSWDMVLPQATGMLVAMLCIGGIKRDKQLFGKKTWQNLLTGVCYAAGNITLMLSEEMNGVAIGFTMAQLNVVVATLGALLILREHKTKKELIFTLTGLALIVAGAIASGLTQ